MSPSLPGGARAIVIGGGVVGCSVLYHLAKAGWTDSVLLERQYLTSGTTWHSAAQVSQLRSTPNLTRLVSYSARLYSRLEEETGQSTGWQTCGNLSLATSGDRMTHFRHAVSCAHAFGIEAELVDRDGAARRWPLIRRDDVLGAIWSPTDGRVNPTDVCQAMVKGAKAVGAGVFEQTPVTGIEKRAGRVSAVRTSAGKIECEVVVDCGGLWGREIAAMAGVAAPLYACEHFYLLTEPIDGTSPDLPTLRDADSHLYIREDVGGLLVGCFEPNPKPLPLEQLPHDSAFALLGEDWDHFEPMMVNALHRIPVLETAGVRMLLNGPESFTLDHNPLLGEAPEVKGFFLACGMNSGGIAFAGGVGMAITGWITQGHQPMDLWAADIRRFAPFQNNLRALAERIPEVLGQHHAIPWPGREYDTVRGLRRSPFHDRLTACRAFFTQRAGWERPAWFAPDGVAPKPEYSFGRQNWFPYAAGEHQAAREGVAVFDLTPFAKILVRGRDAEPVMQRLCANDVGIAPGRVVYTAMLNDRGGFESDLTVTRLAENAYLLVTGTQQGVRDMDWVRRHVAEDECVVVTDATSSWAVLGVVGPASRDLLQRLTPAELSNQGFAFASAREIEFGIARVRAARISYTGELGWELYIPTEFATTVYDELWREGQQAGLRHAGVHALNSLRLEKAYRAWGHDVGPDDTPLEAGLGFAVKFDKPTSFVGRDALLQQRDRGITRRLVTFVLVDPEAYPLGHEPIIRDGRDSGMVTSAAYGHTLGRGIVMGYIDGGDVGREAVLGSTYHIEIAGERFAAMPHLRAPYDPAGSRLRG